MAEGVSVAIVGAGLMGHWHARYARLCGASVCGIVDRDHEAARTLASRFAGAEAFNDLNPLLQQCAPHVVHICTPVESHVTLAEIALDAKAHVLIEKPLTLDEAASRELLSRAERQGRLLAPVHQFLLQDGFLRAQDALPGLGRILHIEATICSAGGKFDKGSGDEIAGEILPHPLSMVERLLPGSLDVTNWRILRPISGEWRITGDGPGVSFSILISLQGRPTEASMRIITDGGIIDLDLFHGFSRIDRAPANKSAKIKRPFRRAAAEFQSASWNLTRRLLRREFAYPGLRRLISRFHAAALHGAPSPIGAEEVLAVARTRDFLLRSGR